MADYPRVVAMGPLETMTIHGPEEHDGAVRLAVGNELRPGARVPMHAHHFQEEAITVISGRIGYRVASEPARAAGAGETVVFGPGKYHAFWAEGDETLRVQGYIEPPLNMEYLFTKFAESVQEHGGKRPGLLDVAYLIHRYRAEYGFGGPRVLRALVPLLAGLARLTGRARKYADAPPSATAADARLGQPSAAPAPADVGT